jgi:hypothetical protein
MQNSNPSKLNLVYLNSKIRNTENLKAEIPISTWRPWNPVAIKKIDPNLLSQTVNPREKYSKACKVRK